MEENNTEESQISFFKDMIKELRSVTCNKIKIADEVCEFWSRNVLSGNLIDYLDEFLILWKDKTWELMKETNKHEREVLAVIEKMEKTIIRTDGGFSDMRHIKSRMLVEYLKADFIYLFCRELYETEELEYYRYTKLDEHNRNHRYSPRLEDLSNGILPDAEKRKTEKWRNVEKSSVLDSLRRGISVGKMRYDSGAFLFMYMEYFKLCEKEGKCKLIEEIDKDILTCDPIQLTEVSDVLKSIILDLQCLFDEFQEDVQLKGFEQSLKQYIAKNKWNKTAPLDLLLRIACWKPANVDIEVYSRIWTSYRSEMEEYNDQLMDASGETDYAEICQKMASLSKKVEFLARRKLEKHTCTDDETYVLILLAEVSFQGRIFMGKDCAYAEMDRRFLPAVGNVHYITRCPVACCDLLERINELYPAFNMSDTYNGLLLETVMKLVRHLPEFRIKRDFRVTLEQLDNKYQNAFREWRLAQYHKRNPGKL